MQLWSWLFKRQTPAAAAPWLPDKPAEGWGTADYCIDWDDMGLPYVTIDAHGDVCQHEAPPFTDETFGVWRCYGRTSHYDTTTPPADWRQCAWSTPIDMDLTTDENGNMYRVYPDWMREASGW